MSDTAIKNTDPETATKQEEDLTYGDIVWGQLRKNTYAIYALYMLIGLFAIAIYSPLLASDRPFVWTQDGVTTYPWFSSLFDRNYFENAVDIFFNLLMVASIPVIGIWYGGMKYLQKNEPVKRPRRRKIQRMTFTLIALVFGTYITMLASPYSSYWVWTNKKKMETVMKHAKSK